MDRVRSFIDSIRRTEPHRGVVVGNRDADGRASVARRIAIGASIPRPIRMDVGFRLA